jgi:hypothetical protein
MRRLGLLHFSVFAILPGCMILHFARLLVFCHFAGLDDFPFVVWGFGLVYLWPHFGQAAIFAWGELACLNFGHEAFRPAAFQYFWPHFGQAAIFARGVLTCLIFGHEAFRPAAFQCFSHLARLHDFAFCPAFSFLPFCPAA